MGIFDSFRLRNPYESEAAETEGWVAAEKHVNALKQRFETAFDPENREATEDMYREAERLERLLHNGLMELTHTGAFRERGTGLGPLKGGMEQERKAGQKRVAERAAALVGRLTEIIEEIDAVVPVASLERFQGSVIPLEGGWAKGFNGMQQPMLRKYLQELELLQDAEEEVLAPIREASVTGGVLLSEDIRKLASIRRTAKIDLSVVRPLTAEARSQNPDRYNFSTLAGLRKIQYILKGITEKHERTFSKHGLSKGDRIILEWLGGVKVEGAMFEGDPVPVLNADAEIHDPNGYLVQLEAVDLDFKGKSEPEIQKALKKAYYRRAKVLHPDYNPDPNAKPDFEKLTAAFETLKDPTKRVAYLKG